MVTGFFDKQKAEILENQNRINGLTISNISALTGKDYCTFYTRKSGCE